MLSRYDIVLIGAGGFVGRHLQHALQRRRLQVLRVTSAIEEASRPDTLIWNYQTALPAAAGRCDVIVNCAKSPDWAGARHVIDSVHMAVLDSSASYVHLSSNAAFTRARGCWGALIAGDDYIRAKRLEARHVHQRFARRPHLVVYPGVLLGKGGGWDVFMNDVARAHRIHGLRHADARSEAIQIGDFCDRLADAIVNRRQGDLSIPDPSDTTPVWRELVRQHARPDAQLLDDGDYLFFRSRPKEWIMRALACRLIPDALALRAFARLRSRSTPSRTGAAAHERLEDLHIEGMAKFYLSQSPK